MIQQRLLLPRQSTSLPSTRQRKLKKLTTADSNLISYLCRNIYCREYTSIQTLLVQKKKWMKRKNEPVQFVPFRLGETKSSKQEQVILFCDQSPVHHVLSPQRLWHAMATRTTWKMMNFTQNDSKECRTWDYFEIAIGAKTKSQPTKF